MPPSSFTSASDGRSRRRAIAVFAIVCALLLAPYEVLVRRSEAKYGVARAFFSESTSPLPKVDLLHHVAARSKELDVLVVGSSIGEFGIDPRLLQRALVPGSERPVLNASLGFVSSLVGLELAEYFGLRARWTVISVTPMDFTTGAKNRGDRFVRHARELTRGPNVSADVRERVEETTGAAVRSLLHCASPMRRRTLPQWLAYWRMRPRPDLLAFLNSEAVIDPPCGTCWDGYVGSTGPNGVDARFFDATADWEPPGRIDDAPRGFVTDHPPHVAAMAQRIARLRAAGSNVVLVRLPTSVHYRRTEDAEAPMFDATMRALAARAGVPYLDAIMPPAFATDRRNFVDTHHLSYRGSRAFTLALAQTLR